MIMRDHQNIIWNRKPDPGQSHVIRLVSGQNDQEIEIHSFSLEAGIRTQMTEDQFFDMVQAGAKHFGKKINVEDAPILCPACNSETDVIVRGNHEFQYRRICKSCFLSSNYCDTPEKADDVFNRITFLPINEPITIEEAAERR
jgi:hypothetical protein